MEPSRSQKECVSIENIIKKSLLKGNFSIVTPCKDQYISNIFTVPKPDGSDRLVINLKSFNTFVATF